LNHVLVGDDPDWPDELLNGGNTPYDAVTSLIWTPEGLLACGNTGLGNAAAGWVMGLTEELGVKYYSVFDGNEAERFLAVADAGDGLAVLSNSRSVSPLGQGGESIGVLMKLPWEGMMRFHEDTGVRSLFLQPRIYNSAATEEFQVTSSLQIPNAAPLRFSNGFSSITSSNLAATLTAADPVAPLKSSTNVTLIALEQLDGSSVSNFATWAAYHRLPAGNPPESDTDADGTPDLLESYFGSNPWSPGAGPLTLTIVVTNNTASAVLEFQRQTFARDYDVSFETSENLGTWAPAQGVAETVTALSPGLEQVQLRYPAAARATFFRASLKESSPP
jgi:hypothetical protein